MTAHPDHILDAVLEFIEAVAPQDRFVIGGESFGGYLARGAVYREGDRIDGMFISVPLVPLLSTEGDPPTHTVIGEDSGFVEGLKDDEQFMRDMVVAQSSELLEEARQYLPAATPPGGAEFWERLQKSNRFSYNVDSLQVPFSGPSLILGGRQDNWCGYRGAYRLLDQYPRATYAVLDRAGHFLPAEQRTLFNTLAREWLDRVEEYSLRRARPSEG